MVNKILPFLLAILLFSCNTNSSNNEEAKAVTTSSKSEKEKEKKEEEKPDPQTKLADLKLPAGFEIAIFAKDVENARSMCLSPGGTLFVGTRSKGDVYAIVDEDKDFKADKVYTLATDLNMPNGVAFKDGSLYVAEVDRILRFDDIENNLDNPPKYEVVTNKYPSAKHHGWKYIAFGPDDKLYVPVGAPCNICESKKKIFNSITRINPDGTDLEVVHEGVRNTVGFTWHPETKEMWFTDNGRDWMGDDMPSCELNRAPKDFLHFGYPYCHQGDTPDPDYGEGKSCADYVAPAQNVGPHVAPLGCEFYTGTQFPSDYQGQIFVAEHGSWNRTKKSGYKLSMATLEGNKVTSYKPFVEGWLEADESVWGRPVDVELLPDGSMLLSDDYANVIYRITYKG